ncbi:hypothetical protein ACU635_58845 [[Actinomadura] parvosata]|uniref:hypothetical protein n=1 Tax=[Actinomadura] parvosata TaxID=1955412 RepID=UPI00406CF762
MPRTLKVAQFIITVEVAFGLVGFALVLAGFFATFKWGILVPLLHAGGRVALLGWLLSRWSTRRVWLRWAIIGVELLEFGVSVLDLVQFSTVTWGALLGRHTLGWAVIVLLLLPQAGRWFNASRA